MNILVFVRRLWCGCLGYHKEYYPRMVLGGDFCWGSTLFGDPMLDTKYSLGWLKYSTFWKWILSTVNRFKRCATLYSYPFQITLKFEWKEFWFPYQLKICQIFGQIYPQMVWYHGEPQEPNSKRILSLTDSLNV